MQKPRPFRGMVSDADLMRLREFIEIVEAGGITAAEARLGKGKSAISLGLSRLEERLGLRLCERGRSGFRLTEQGHAVHSAAVQLMGEIGRFADFIGEAARKLEGEITLYADDSFVFEFSDPLARAIATFSDRYPSVKLNVRMSAPDQIHAVILEGRADLGFTTLGHPDDAIHAVRVCEEPTGIFCGREHPLFGRDDGSITLDELREHGFVAPEVVQDRAFGDFVRKLTITAVAPTILSRIILVLSSRYLGIVPLRFARHWVEMGAIRELRVAGGRAVNDCFLIHRKARPLGLGGTILRSILIGELQQDREEAASAHPLAGIGAG